MPRLSMRFMGGIQVQLDGKPVATLEYDKVRALLAYLAIEADRPHRREALAGLLWPDLSERRARHNLSQALLTLRRALGDGEPVPCFAATPAAIQFNAASDHWLDVSTFTSLLAACKAHPHWRLETCGACRDLLERAAKLYDGPFLKGLSVPGCPAFEEWQLVWRERLHHGAADVLRALAVGCDHRGERAAALRYAEQWVAADPWHEGAHQQLMRALAQCGRRVEALAQYKTCRRTLDEELGVLPADEMVSLYEAIRDGAALPVLYPPLPNNLPASTTPFVGREALLDETRGLLQDPDVRLVTLVGPGGCGKTRLALQAGVEVVAGALHDRFPDGVYLVPLVSLRARDSIGPAVAQALGTGAGPGGDPEGRLLRALRRKRLLLILDNYEHLLDGSREGRLSGAGAVSEILSAAPGVQVLVTSRARLNVLAEHVFPVGGMAYPLTCGQDGEQIAQHSAVALFLDRARTVRPAFAPGGATLEQIGRICRLVEGIPLAILLAASWVDVLSPAEIADRLAASLDLLAADLRDLPARQRSMRAVFDASWAVLSEQARAAFARMSVFRGGFIEEAARAVACTEMHTLRELVRTSFLQRTEAGRYEAHELLRQYGAEQLEEMSEDREKTLDRHCAYYAAFYTARAEVLRDRNIAPVAGEVADIRAAWHWALDAARVDRVRQFVGRLDLGLSQLDERTFGERAREWFSDSEAAWAQAVSVLRAAGEDRENAIALGIALRDQAGCAYELGHLDRAATLLEESMAILECRGAKAELSIAKVDAYASVGKTAMGAERLLQEGLALAREANYEAGIGRACHLLAGPALHRRAYDQAERYIRDALSIFGRMGHYRGVGTCIGLGGLAAIAYARGNDDAARQCIVESIEIAKEIQWPEWSAEMRAALSTVLIALGDLDTARAQCRRVTEIAQDVGDDRLLACALCGLGDAALADGDVEAAKGTYRQALVLTADDPRFLPKWRAVYSVAMLRAREGCIERAAELSALGLDPRWAWNFWYGAGLRLTIELERQMAPDVFAAARASGRAMSLQETVEELLEALGGRP